MIKEIHTYLEKRKDEIYSADTIEKAVLIYLNNKFFDASLITIDSSSFQEEEMIAIFGYTTFATPANRSIQQILQSVLGKKAIKKGMHYSERPLLLAGMYLAAAKISDQKSITFLNEIIQNNVSKFEYFDRFLLSVASNQTSSVIYNDIANENIHNILALYALQKVRKDLVKIDKQTLRNNIINKLGPYILTSKISFKDIFLIELFFQNELIGLFRYKNIDSLTLIKNILNSFGDSLFKIIKDRRKNHQLFQINDEYDVQDLLFSILKPIFSDLKFEEWTPKFAGSSKRVDLIIPSEAIIIEVKMIKKNEDPKKFIEELNVDISSYHSHFRCNFLLGFIYDPYHKVNDPNEFYELNGEKSNNDKKYYVEIIINR